MMNQGGQLWNKQYVEQNWQDSNNDWEHGGKNDKKQQWPNLTDNNLLDTMERAEIFSEMDCQLEFSSGPFWAKCLLWDPEEDHCVLPKSSHDRRQE